MELLFSSITGLLSGILGAMGMGGGGILIIYLSIFSNIEQSKAQGINLIFFIPSAIIATIIYHKKSLIKWKVALPLAGLGLIGAFAGTYILSFIDGFILRKLFGAFLLLMSVKQFISSSKD